MANRPAPALALREGDREELARLTRSSSVRAGLAQRARIVLLAADGVSNTAIAERVGVSRPTVIGVAGPVRRRTGWPGWTTSRARVGRGRIDHRDGRGGDVDAAAEEVRGDALVDAGCWPGT